MNASSILASAIAVFASITAACSTPGASSSHLIAEQITLVDQQGVPWMRLGPRNLDGFQGMEILTSDGGVALKVGIQRVMVESEQKDAPSAQDMPMLFMESSTGNGIATLLCHELGATLELNHGDETSCTVSVSDQETVISLASDSGFDDADSPLIGDRSKTTKEVRIEYSAEKLLLVVISADGTRKDIDLRTLIQ